MPKKYLVSACLAGFPCRFDGSAKPRAEIVALHRRGLIEPVCPESMSGLPAPRDPCERIGDRYVLRNGADVTEAILRGAEKAMQKALKSGARAAVLKSRSPSCGTGLVYDGNFNKTLVPGNGAFAEKLLNAGFEVFDEHSLPSELLALLRESGS